MHLRAREQDGLKPKKQSFAKTHCKPLRVPDKYMMAFIFIFG